MPLHRSGISGLASGQIYDVSTSLARVIGHAMTAGRGLSIIFAIEQIRVPSELALPNRQGISGHEGLRQETDKTGSYGRQHEKFIA